MSKVIGLITVVAIILIVCGIAISIYEIDSEPKHYDCDNCHDTGQVVDYITYMPLTTIINGGNGTLIPVTNMIPIYHYKVCPVCNGDPHHNGNNIIKENTA